MLPAVDKVAAPIVATDSVPAIMGPANILTITTRVTIAAISTQSLVDKLFNSLYPGIFFKLIIASNFKEMEVSKIPSDISIISTDTLTE